jgi:hypothetical protein
MDRNDFYQEAMKPEFPNKMSFQLERTDPDDGVTFSKEGFEGISNQIHDYIMARTYAEYKRTGKGPKNLRIMVDVDFRTIPEDDLEIFGIPWYHLYDQPEKFSIADGLNRLPLDKK